MVAGSQSPYAQNDKLSTARGIGVDELDGPEDVVFDQEDNLYCGNRHGDVVRFFPPHYNRHELHAHIGGMTAGLAVDRDGSLVVCSPGVGLSRVTREGGVIRLSDETNRSFWSILDDSAHASRRRSRHRSRWPRLF